MYLWIALAAILYLNYDAWMRDYRTSAEAPAVVNSAAPGGGGTLGESVPQPASAIAVNAASAARAIESPPTAAAPAGAPAESPFAPPGGAAAGPASGVAASASSPPLHVRTDVLDLDINLRGGELDRAALLKYPVHKDTPNVPVRLLDDQSEATLYLVQTGLTGGANEAAPTHLATWSASKQTYELESGAAELRLPLTWTDGHGLTVTKTFVFTRGSYAIDLVYDVANQSAEARSLASYAQILRHWEHPSRSYFDVETYAYKGPAVDDGTKYRKLSVESDEESKFSETVTNGWLASLQHYFVAAIVPPNGRPYKYQLQVRNSEYLLSATGPAIAVPAGGSAQFHEKLFVGPKLQAQLTTTAPLLDRTADYGKLTVIATPLFAALKWIHGLIGNWGWSIIIVTAMIKLLFYPLSQASGRSMAKMRAVAPRMKLIQESYKDDREKLGRAMMELYKKEKINPLAGCLPMVVQIPFFISFYWVLLESVEMRQAPFLLWINDLSSRDPFFVLPLLMGSAMFAQFKLNPAPPDPMQAKIMQFMPLVMTTMMAWFPSGLVLYWLTNTVLSIAQQYRVNQVVEAEASKRRG
jgi:YidC/Oxa1 family membrane protein insertase